MCVCVICDAKPLDWKEMQLGFRMDLAQTATGSSRGLKAVR